MNNEEKKQKVARLERELKFMEIKGFMHPTLLKISLAIFFAAVCVMVLSPIFAKIQIIPCKVQYFPGDPHQSGLCTVNPTGMVLDSVYLHYIPFDYVYQSLYIGMMIVVLPYLLSCIALHYYFRLIEKLRGD